jgi:hypothetical protein
LIQLSYALKVAFVFYFGGAVVTCADLPSTVLDGIGIGLGERKFLGTRFGKFFIV